jgi:uncharacterized protein (DUF302 family)
MKLYNKEGVEVYVTKHQIEMFKQAGWSQKKPDNSSKIIEKTISSVEVEPELKPEIEPSKTIIKKKPLY